MGASRSKFSVLLVGLEGSGKSTMLSGLKSGDDADESGRKSHIAGEHEIIEKVYRKNRIQFHFLDLAGSKYLRPLWRHYFRSVRPNVVLFVVDVYNQARMPEVKEELQKVLYDPNLQNSMILIIGNLKSSEKQDVTNLDFLLEKLDLHLGLQVFMLDCHDQQELKSTMHKLCQLLIK